MCPCRRASAGTRMGGKAAQEPPRHDQPGIPATRQQGSGFAHISPRLVRARRPIRDPARQTKWHATVWFSRTGRRNQSAQDLAHNCRDGMLGVLGRLADGVACELDRLARGTN